VLVWVTSGLESKAAASASAPRDSARAVLPPPGAGGSDVEKTALHTWEHGCNCGCGAHTVSHLPVASRGDDLV
jgi:hypothetical protein